MFLFVTELGRTPVALMFVAVAWRRSRTLAAHLAAATIGGWFIGEVLKLVFARPRPIEILPLAEAAGYSFPSGHAIVASATYATAAILICRGLQRQSHRILVVAAAILTIALVAFSRVYLGVHYASDAIGGILIGTAWALILGQHWYHLQNDEELDDNDT
jgi:undecaprenyl-diphosphatase